MNDHLSRIFHYKGTPYEIGLAAGRELGSRFSDNIDNYILGLEPITDMPRLHTESLSWLNRLPKRYLDEFTGLSDGANIPLQKIAEWAHIDACEKLGCSGAVYLHEGKAWVARNNDTYAPELWGYATIKDVEGRIPTIHFCMEGDVFTPTGINREKLWLHYNYLTIWDKPAPGKPHLAPYVFLTEALECCRTIADVERMLAEIDRDGGMLLFAVDGKTNEFALFDCQCSQHARREITGSWIVGTNHFLTCEDPTLSDADAKPMGTLARYQRVESMLQELVSPPDFPADLIRILADDQVERPGPNLWTAYSNVACPSAGEIWYTFGGYPSASRGDWQKLDWPW